MPTPPRWEFCYLEVRAHDVVQHTPTLEENIVTTLAPDIASGQHTTMDVAMREAARLGALGWEPVGIATRGDGEVHLALKRPLPPGALPEGE